MKKISILLVGLLAFFAVNAQHTVTLNVNMQPAIDSGLFDPADTTQAVFIAGDFWNGVNQWQTPGSNPDFQMTDPDGDKIYSITLDSVADTIAFKFFLVFNNTESWENGEWDGDPNREVVLSSDSTLTFNWGVFGVAGFNELRTLNVTVFPNPATDYITVDAQGFAQIINLAGQTVISQDLSVSNTINVADLTKGVYIVKVANKEGIAVKKIIIK